MFRIAASVIVVLGLMAPGIWPQAPAAAAPPGRQAGASRQDRIAATLRIMEEIQHLQRNTGMATAVSVDGETVHTGTLGQASVELQVPVRHETRFLVASLTKAFTGAALMKLREKGLVRLDAPVTRLIPGAPAGTGAAVTPRLLAAHLAGIRRYHDGEKTPEFLNRHYDTAREALEIFIGDPLVSEPGASYLYTSFGYNLLAAVMEAAADEPFTGIVEKEILSPLGLESTGFHDVRKITPGLASNYTYYVPYTYEPLEEPMPAPWEDYSYNMGGGNMYTTAEDLLRFARAFMEEGFFTAESLELLHARQGTEEAPSPWSFGWFVAPGEGTDLRIYITGAFTGTQAALHVWPRRKIAVAVLSNCWGVGSKSGDMVMKLPLAIGEIWTEGWTPGG